MKELLTLVFVLLSIFCFAQTKQVKSTIDFVQIIDNNEKEALYYYNNNWKQLRKNAIEKGYISDYKLLSVNPTDDAPFHLMLVTTYPSEEMYQKREEHFRELIDASDGLKLLNDKKPAEFRKTVFNKDPARHIE